MSGKTEYLTFDTAEAFYPLDEKVISESGIALFESQKGKFSEEAEDVRFLASLPRLDVWYGAQTPRMHPFICIPPEPLTTLPTARKVLELLRASRFKSAHINDLDVADVPFPGYHPHSDNDEIHSDANEQYFFAREDPDADEGEVLEEDDWAMQEAAKSKGYHRALQHYMLGEQLYYVLIHTKPQKHEGFEFSEYVIIFAVGVSPVTGNMIGVVSHQVCHNLCD